MKRNAIYYLLKDILDSFSARTDPNLIGVLNLHFIAKETVKLIFEDEIKKPKPKYFTLRAVLMVEEDFLRAHPQSAFYEVIELLPGLDYCLRQDPRVTIRKLSTQVILRLFSTLYFEFRILPTYHIEDEEYICQFKKYFSKQDIANILQTTPLTRFIFERQYGIDFGKGSENKKRINEILDRFYSD